MEVWNHNLMYKSHSKVQILLNRTVVTHSSSSSFTFCIPFALVCAELLEMSFVSVIHSITIVQSILLLMYHFSTMTFCSLLQLDVLSVSQDLSYSLQLVNQWINVLLLQWLFVCTSAVVRLMIVSNRFQRVKFDLRVTESIGLTIYVFCSRWIGRQIITVLIGHR